MIIAQSVCCDFWTEFAVEFASILMSGYLHAEIFFEFFIKTEGATRFCHGTGEVVKFCRAVSFVTAKDR